MTTPALPENHSTEEPAGLSAAGEPSIQGPGESPSSDPLEASLRALPPYTRSLLKVPVTVTVSLARTQLPLERVLRLGPGSIIRFDQPCDAPLTMEVAGQAFASGEAVKVGDKFGLWITSMQLPAEKFRPLS